MTLADKIRKFDDEQLARFLVATNVEFAEEFGRQLGIEMPLTETDIRNAANEWVKALSEVSDD